MVASAHATPPGLRRDVAERDVDGARVAAADDASSWTRSPGLCAATASASCVRRGDRLAVDRDDRVAADGTPSRRRRSTAAGASSPAFAAGLPLTTRAIDGAVRGEAAHDAARRAGRSSRPGRRARRAAACPVAISCAGDRRAVSLGIAKPTPTFASTVPPSICALTPIDAAVAVEQRAAGVAVVDRRVRLDRVRRW